jgi:hypothetical protein
MAATDTEAWQLMEGVGMDGMIKTLMRRLLPLSSCSVGAMVLLALAFSRGLLSPRGLGIAILALGVAAGIWAVLIVKKSAKEFKEPSGPSGLSIDAVTRKRRLLGIRVGKIAIVVLALLLIFGLLQGGPLLPLLVGAIVNLCIMGAVIQVVVRLQRSLH